MGETSIKLKLEIMEITSIFIVTDYKTGKQEEVTVTGSGQDAIKVLVKEYPRHTKFVLDGFEIDGDYKPLYIKRWYND
jgi:hypothetical protein